MAVAKQMAEMMNRAERFLTPIWQTVIAMLLVAIVIAAFALYTEFREFKAQIIQWQIWTDKRIERLETSRADSPLREHPG